MDLKQDLYVCTALSAGLQWRPGGEYCTSASWLVMKSSTSCDRSLSMRCREGLKPRASHHLYTWVYALRSSERCLDFMGMPLMKLASKM